MNFQLSDCYKVCYFFIMKVQRFHSLSLFFIGNLWEKKKSYILEIVFFPLIIWSNPNIIKGFN